MTLSTQQKVTIKLNVEVYLNAKAYTKKNNLDATLYLKHTTKYYI